jgi:hypothetical protein
VGGAKLILKYLQDWSLLESNSSIIADLGRDQLFSQLQLCGFVLSVNCSMSSNDRTEVMSLVQKLKADVSGRDLVLASVDRHSLFDPITEPSIHQDILRKELHKRSQRLKFLGKKYGIE